MARDNKVQITGDQMDLKQGPRDMRRDSFGGGSTDISGEQLGLSRRTTPMASFDKHISGGKVTMLGGDVGLNRTAHPGWESASTQMSNNTLNPDSTLSSYPGKKSK